MDAEVDGNKKLVRWSIVDSRAGHGMGSDQRGLRDEELRSEWNESVCLVNGEYQTNNRYPIPDTVPSMLRSHLGCPI